MDKRKRRRLLGRALAGCLLALALGAIALGFMPKPVPVSGSAVLRQALEVTVDESGKTRLRARFTVSAPVFGELTRIALRAGDAVEAQHEVARIVPVVSGLLDERSRAAAIARVAAARDNVARAETSIHRATAAAELTRAQAERLRALKRASGTSQQALEQAEFEQRAADEDLASANYGRRLAENELASARAALTPAASRGDAALPVLSPVSGRVLRIFRESGGVVNAGEPLLEIGDPHDLELVVDVLSTEAVGIAVGAPATIERWGGEGALHAVVVRKEPSAFTTRSALGVEEQRVPVVLDLTDSAERVAALSDGYRVEAHIRTAFVATTLVAPAGAVFRDGAGWAVFVIRGAKAHKTPVTIGLRSPDFVEINAGVAEGDTLALYPSDRVRDGVDVSVTSDVP